MSEYIFRDSVFILGAGSSCPYDFPSGKDLKDEIINLVNNHPDNSWSPTQINDANFLKYLKNEGYGLSKINELRDKLQISGATSIDSFLQDSHEIKPELVRLSKMIIYYFISQKEVARVLKHNDWIEPFVHYSMEYHRDEFLSKPPQVLSFNYDNLFKKKVEFILRTQYHIQDYKYLRIKHIYGRTLGLNFDREHEKVVKVEYFDEIKEESEHISLIRKPNDAAVSNFHKIINESKKIVILGYGFDRKNNALLFDRNSLEDHIRNKRLFSTGYGVSETTIEHMMNRVQDDSYLPIEKDETCKMLIEKMIPNSFF